MKERIVIERNTETSEYYKKFPDRSGKQIEHIEVLAPIEQNVRFEQVPETFEELKELCKGLESVSIHDVGGYIKLSINGNLIYFFIAGEMEGKIDITNNTFLERFCVIQKATPQQMWQIIKNL